MGSYRNKNTGRIIDSDDYFELDSFDRDDYERVSKDTSFTDSAIIGAVTDSALLGGLLGGSLLGGLFGDLLDGDLDD